MYQTYYVNNNNGGGTGGDQEELSVLPRHTKVVVTGNNRTKSVLVGLHGVVKKAVGLGGWHWLVGKFFYKFVGSLVLMLFFDWNCFVF
ncbi:putative histone deacetylase complex subunit SAP30/SAP30 [Helianthus annuus]|nr:putative histone deacetylase complex subunit SAP30/SAP30 [Helianthus annuus]KAJ0638505.1 putative histone deacetylase complex subunit SAP30/SAP30 [Helianthus annuus]